MVVPLNSFRLFNPWRYMNMNDKSKTQFAEAANRQGRRSDVEGPASVPEAGDPLGSGRGYCFFPFCGVASAQEGNSPTQLRQFIDQQVAASIS